MTTTPTTPPVDQKSLRRAFLASLSGTSLEWYDFAVYSATAALVFPQLFFPNESPLTGSLLAFSTYAVGYVSRPVGGIVFGRFGDVIGRKRVLVYTLVVIGVATFLIGLLPTYGAIGVTAPILLVLLRFAQGVGVGGEWGGAVLLSSEFGDPYKRGFWSSAAQIGPPAGNLLANGALAALTVSLTNDQFLNWGWRVAFLLSAVLIAAGLWIRLKLEDTPVFKALAEHGERPTAPVREVFTTQGRQLLAACLSRIGPDVVYALFVVFTLSYGTKQLGFSRAEVLGAILVGSTVQLAVIPLAGALSDRVNRRWVYGLAAAAAAVYSFVFFPAIGTKSVTLLFIGVIVGLILHSIMYGPQAAFVVEQFSPKLRYIGSSLTYTIAGVFGGAIAPLAFTALQGGFGSWVPVGIYVLVACLLTLLGLRMGRDPDRAEDEAYLVGAASGSTPQVTLD